MSIATFPNEEMPKQEALYWKVEATEERLQEYGTARITAAVTGKFDVRNAPVSGQSHLVMRIDRLRLTGFRCFEQAEFEFAPQFNLIVGDNGAGKTSILEALAVAAGSWLLGIRGFDQRHLLASDVRVRPQGSNGDFRFEEVEQTEVWARGVVQSEALQWERALRGRKGRTTTKEASTIREIAESHAQSVRNGQDTALVLPLISYYGTGRLWNIPRDIKKALKEKRSKPSRLDGYRNSVDPRCSPADFMKWLSRQEWIAFQEGAEPPICTAVKQAVVGCLEDGKRIWFSAKQEQVLVEFGNQGIHAFDQLSDGQRNMVAMVGDIAIKAALINSNLGSRAVEETPGVVLIDELDLHLHPKWQRRVVADLKRTFPKIQFFCTTHSPQIIGEVPREAVHVLGADGSQPAPVAYGADSNWILEHVMGAAQRSAPATELIHDVEDALEEGDLESAKQELKKLRFKVGSEEGEVARLEGSIRNMEALANEED
ncbi:MAG: AAA family ATPase [Verrucomicrobia bacterium]|nr:AAA family ATPase [Verrucomicrobiota bacterium]